MKILGLDISTSCTGWCLLSENGSLIDMGSIPLSRERDFFKKADLVRSSLELLKKQHHVLVEMIHWLDSNKHSNTPIRELVDQVLNHEKKQLQL